MDAKKHFARSLSKLTESRTIDEITVADILKNSELSKSTFYNHFKDKYDLMAWKHISECGEQVTLKLDAGCSYRECMEPAFRYMLENQQFYVNTFKSTDHNSMRGFMYHTSEEFNVKYLKLRGIDTDDARVLLLIDAFSCGQTLLAAKWANGRINVSVEEVIELMVRLAPSEFADAYKAKTK